jgi:hypothetical protein
MGTESDLLCVVTCHFHRCHATRKTMAMGALMWWSASLRKTLWGCLPDAHVHHLLEVVIGEERELVGGGCLGGHRVRDR